MLIDRGLRKFGWDRDDVRQIAVLADAHSRGLSNEQRVILAAIGRARHHALGLIRDGLRREALGKRADSTTNSRVQTRAVLLKPVGDLCNLRCTYCYEGSGSERVEDARMTVATLTAIVRDVLAQSHGTVQFLWHGGEPLMAGVPFFERGMELEQQYNVNGCKIVNTVQTNGLLINEQWMSLFQKHRFNIGISVDGPQEFHDQFRIGPCGQGTYAGVAKAIKRLQDCGFDVGAISVISPALATRADGMFSTFRSLGIDAYDVHPNFGSSSQLSGEPLHPELFSTFVNKLFDLWLDSGETQIRIRIFDDFFQSMIGYSPTTCYFAGTCSNIMGFEANGDAVPCTRPFDRSKYTFGNIGRESLTVIQQSSSFRTFLQEDLAGQAKSQPCRWYDTCHNGCPQHRSRDGKQAVDGVNLYCRCQSGIEGGYAAIFDHAARRCHELLGLRSQISSDESNAGAH